MMRLLGIVLGSMLATGIFVAVVGMPSLHPAEPSREAPGNELPTEPAATPRAEQSLLPPPIATPVETPVETPVATPGAGVSAATEDAAEEHVPAMPEPQIESAPERWYAFWSPFRSRIAANGFVTQLQRVTGLDYRVVNVKPGVYEVAFAYADDAEIQANLAQIAAATGLAVPES